VAALDASIAHGDLETSSQDLARLLGRPATALSEVVRAAYDLFKVKSQQAVIGLIGAGNIGGAVARLAIDAGYNVVLSKSRGPETFSALVQELGPHAQPATPAEAATSGDVVIVTIPLKAYGEVPVEALAGKVVIDTTNYVPDRDGRMADLDDHNTTSSELLRAHLPASCVVKALNTMFFKHLAILRWPHRATEPRRKCFDVQ
jgi:predicted dinucleotide-binding enzyme